MSRLQEFVENARFMTNYVSTALADEFGIPALSQSAKANRLVYLIHEDEDRALRYLRSSRVNVNQHTGVDKTTPLIEAAVTGSIKLTQALLAAGADMKATDKDGLTATDHASRKSDVTSGENSYKHIYRLLETTEEKLWRESAGPAAPTPRR